MSDYRILKTATGTVDGISHEADRLTIGLPGLGQIVSEIGLASQNVKDATPAMMRAAAIAPEVFDAGTTAKQNNLGPTRSNNVVYISGPANPTLVPGG